MAQEAPVDHISDDYDLAAATALALREAQTAEDAEHARQLAAVLRDLAEGLVREADPAGTTAAILPHLNGQLDPAAVDRLLRR